MSGVTPIPSAPNYGVSEDGKVFRIVKSRFGRAVPFEIRPRKGANGYLYVGRGGGGGLKCSTVHRLVASTFFPNPEGLPEVAHNNGVRDDNRVSNLRWDTTAGNAADRLAHGTAWLGSKHRQAKLTEPEVVELRREHGTHEAIASRYGVSRSNVSRIKRGEGWTHV